MDIWHTIVLHPVHVTVYCYESFIPNSLNQRVTQLLICMHIGNASVTHFPIHGGALSATGLNDLNEIV